MDRNIQMVDLQGQYKRLQAEIDEAIQKVLQEAQFIKGPQVGRFEEEISLYLGSKHTIGVANGTDALQICLMALELEPGDEVLLPTFTYVATAEVIALLKLRPVLVDVCKDSMNIEVDRLDNFLSKKTRAIVPVHLFGQGAHMKPLLEWANKNNIWVIEDNAQSLGASFYAWDGGESKMAGTLGHMGITSFFPSKILGAFGDGGAIFTQDTVLADKIRQIANHGQREKYIHERVGVNSRLDTLHAAVLSAKLKHIDQFISRRQAAAAMYDALLKDSDLILPHRSPWSSHVFHQYTLQLPKGMDRERVRAQLMEAGIPTMVYYPLPLHRQKAYAQEGFFPHAEELCQTVLSLPMHTELDPTTLAYIAESLLKTLS